MAIYTEAVRDRMQRSNKYSTGRGGGWGTGDRDDGNEEGVAQRMDNPFRDNDYGSRRVRSGRTDRAGRHHWPGRLTGGRTARRLDGHGKHGVGAHLREDFRR